MANAIKFDTKAKKSGVDDYFKQMFGANTGDIQNIEISKLVPFEGQPFKPYTNEKLIELADDISENGILSPLIVRPNNDAYQILAGHNRANAAQLAGLETVPCIVKTVDDDTAKIIMLNTNLNQRDELLPSEKAFAYKMQLDTIKHQGRRTDLTLSPLETRTDDELNESTLSPLETKKRSDQVVAEKTGDSRANVQRYVRLTYLIPALIDRVDEKQIPFRAGVSLSYCKKEDQQRLLEFMEDNKIETVTLDQAEQIKNLNPFSPSSLPEIFGLKEKREKKAAAKKTLNLKIPFDLLDESLKGYKADNDFIFWISGEINKHMRETNEGA